MTDIAPKMFQVYIMQFIALCIGGRVRSHVRKLTALSSALQNHVKTNKSLATYDISTSNARLIYVMHIAEKYE